jgi:hypothetical protein
MRACITAPVLPVAFCRMIEAIAVVVTKKITFAVFVNWIKPSFHNRSPNHLLEMKQIRFLRFNENHGRTISKYASLKSSNHRKEISSVSLVQEMEEIKNAANTVYFEELNCILEARYDNF